MLAVIEKKILEQGGKVPEVSVKRYTVEDKIRILKNAKEIAAHMKAIEKQQKLQEQQDSGDK